MNAENRDALRRYLLGVADPAVLEEIESRVFSDDEVFWERLAIAEDELVDDYAAGALDADQRVAFETAFLTTDERRAKLAFALAIGAHARQRETERTGIWTWWQGAVSAPRWALAAAAGLLLLVVPGLIGQFAPASRIPSALTVSLAPGLLRDAGGEVARVRPEPGCQVVQFDLTADADPYSAYAATVYDVNGGAIWTQHRLTGIPRDGSTAITLTVPCELLPEGDYWVRLSGLAPEQDPAPLDRYDFRVLR
jgi:hypothetical protein